MISKRVKAIIITDNSVYESTNVRVFKDFILVDNVPYPKPPPRVTEKCIYYIINETTMDKDQLERLERLVAKKETESIFNALLTVANPMKSLLYIAVGALGGMYLQSMISHFMAVLERMPPDAASAIANAAQVIAIIAVIAIPLFLIFARKRKEQVQYA